MKLNKKEISLIKEYIKKITSPKLENIGTGSEFNINKVWDFIESKPFHNKDYSPMFSTAREIYDEFGKKELEMYANFQWNGRNTPIHRKELANLQRIKTMDAASNSRKSKMNESNLICFTINNHELKDELDGNKYLSSKLDYKDIKGDTFLCYPPEIYDKFSDFALSRGYNNSEDFWEVDDEGKEADTDWTDGKFHMKENKKMKKLTVEQKAKVIKFAKTLVDKKIIKENNNYTMISALREALDDLLMKTEMLIDSEYGKSSHKDFKRSWYNISETFEKTFKNIQRSLMVK